jgi:DMSO/TMAO reductase YedYZ molybdopterin-dependent catalytic subunit
VVQARAAAAAAGQHGYPVRVIVPSHAGVRSCKWLKRVLLSPHEAPSHWQQSDYKILPPNNDWQVSASQLCVEKAFFMAC